MEDKQLFEIRNVTKNDIEMKGVFALPANTYLCSYVGDLEDCVKRVDLLNKLDKKESEIHDIADPNLTLVPVDENGKIKEKFILSPSIYFTTVNKNKERAKQLLINIQKEIDYIKNQLE